MGTLHGVPRRDDDLFCEAERERERERERVSKKPSSLEQFRTEKKLNALIMSDL